MYEVIKFTIFYMQMQKKICEFSHVISTLHERTISFTHAFIHKFVYLCNMMLNFFHTFFLIHIYQKNHRGDKRLLHTYFLATIYTFLQKSSQYTRMIDNSLYDLKLKNIQFLMVTHHESAKQTNSQPNDCNQRALTVTKRKKIDFTFTFYFHFLIVMF